MTITFESPAKAVGFPNALIGRFRSADAFDGFKDLLVKHGGELNTDYPRGLERLLRTAPIVYLTPNLCRYIGMMYQELANHPDVTMPCPEPPIAVPNGLMTVVLGEPISYATEHRLLGASIGLVPSADETLFGVFMFFGLRLRGEIEGAVALTGLNVGRNGVMFLGSTYDGVSQRQDGIEGEPPRELALLFMSVLVGACSPSISGPCRQPMHKYEKQRIARAPMPVRVIDLQSRGGSSKGQHREWDKRWVVRGHWRNHWWPKQEQHLLRWIDPYIKGPEDAPLDVRPTVWVKR